MYSIAMLNAFERIVAIPKRSYGLGRRSSGINRNYTRHHFPHSSTQEQARRLRQEIRALAKRAIEIETEGHWTPPVTVWDQLVSSSKEYQKFRQAPVAQLLAIRSNLLIDLKS